MRNPYLFRNQSQESRTKAKILKVQAEQLLNEKLEFLSYEELDGYRYALSNAGATGLTKMIRALNKKSSSSAPANKHDLMILFGDTYSIRENLLKYGFKTKNIKGEWVMVKPVLSDKFEFWKREIDKAADEKGLNIYIFKSDIYSEKKAVDQYLEIKEIIKEESQETMEPIDNPIKGQVVEISSWMARIIGEKTSDKITFRNIKIVEVYRETQKAYLVDLEFFSGVLRSCGFCGLPLTNDISRMTGIGPVCAENNGILRPSLENAKIVMSELDRKFKRIGVIGKVWLPKSQIKNHGEGNA